MDTTKLIETYYACFNRKDWAGMLEALTDDVVHDLNQGRREIGKQKFAAFLEVMNKHYDERLDAICVMTSTDGRRAAAEFQCSGTYLHSQAGLPEARRQTYKLPVGAFFEIRGDKISRVTNYYNLSDWLRQVQP